MKVNSIKQHSLSSKSSQNFKGGIDSIANFIAKHPVGVATLAGSSVVAQKIVMSGSESTIGPAVDILTGKVISKATKQKDDRIEQSSKVQAIRTFAQSVGGTITGVAIRTACILAMSALVGKKISAAFNEKSGEVTGSAAKLLIPENWQKAFQEKVKNGESIDCLYLFKENAEKWGKAFGGGLAILIMLFTNFLLDVPLINFINKHATNLVNKISNKPEKTDNKEAK